MLGHSLYAYAMCDGDFFNKYQANPPIELIQTLRVRLNALWQLCGFDNVPKGALLWLRDLTEGKDELPFFYKGGRQIFIGDL